MGAGYELARAVEFLIHEGHDEARVWKYTPRRVMGFVQLAMRRKIGERRDMLFISSQGARGDPKELKRLFREWEQEAR